jgi:hypothetical protein
VAILKGCPRLSGAGCGRYTVFGNHTRCAGGVASWLSLIPENREKFFIDFSYDRQVTSSSPAGHASSPFFVVRRRSHIRVIPHHSRFAEILVRNRR